MNLRTSTRTSGKPAAWIAGLTGIALAASVFVSAPVSAFPDPPAELKDLNTVIRKQAPKILAELQKRGYKNVGVLKFQAKVDKQANTMHSGRLNQQMATRIENALILASDAEKPAVGIVRDASAAAMKADKKATWLDAQGRTKLFNHTYPMAWGNTSKKVEAFLTGVVGIDSKADVVNVAVHVFDKDDAKPTPLVTFQAKLTSSLLSETGQRFLVKKRQIQDPNGGGPVTTEDPVIPDNTNMLTEVDQNFNNILDFKILYDGVEAGLTPDSSGSFKCNPPGIGQKIVFKVKSTEKIGLVMFVNGVNTLMMAKANEADVAQHYRWILDPNQEYSIEGYYPSFKEVKKFKATPEGEVTPGELGPEDKWGLIELHVFKDSGGTTGIGGSNPSGATDPGPDLQNPGNSNGVPELELRKLPLNELKKKLAVVNKTKARNLIGMGGSESSQVQEVTFNGTLYVSRSIMYYQKMGTTPITP